MKSKTYEEFVEKFKPKKTTDDCFTPPLVYEAVKNWACREYGIDERQIVRPFWPGGDFERFAYPEGCVVLDNPPFSILTKICKFYQSRGIRYFLFAPGNMFSQIRQTMATYICQGDEIVYENGAKVRTNFLTNMAGDVVAQSAPELSRAIRLAMKKCQREKKVELPKYEYPDEIVTAAMLQKYAKHGIDFRVWRGDCVFVSRLDAQNEHGKGIFGGGLLLSDRAAAERAAAERAAAERAAAERAAAERAAAERAAAIRWELSERELEIVRRLGAKRETEGDIDERDGDSGAPV